MSDDPGAIRCEAGNCPEDARWTLERSPDEFKTLCDRHYALWPVEGGMFRRTMLARQWGWPELVEANDGGDA